MIDPEFAQKIQQVAALCDRQTILSNDAALRGQNATLLSRSCIVVDLLLDGSSVKRPHIQYEETLLGRQVSIVQPGNSDDLNRPRRVLRDQVNRLNVNASDDDLLRVG
jgi:hypothetical protein